MESNTLDRSNDQRLENQAATRIQSTRQQRAISRAQSWIRWPQFLKNAKLTSKSQNKLSKGKARSKITPDMISRPSLISTTNPAVASVERVPLTDQIESIFEPLQSRHGIHADANSEAQSKNYDDVQALQSRESDLSRIETDNTVGEETHIDHQDEQRSLHIGERVARKKKETLNLCRDKIKKLTGHGRIPRKRVPTLPTQQTTLDDTAAAELSVTAPEVVVGQSDNDSIQRSVAGSIVSVSNQLDSRLHSTNLSPVQSRSSFFSLQERPQGTDSEHIEQHGLHGFELDNDQPESSCAAIKRSLIRPQSSRPEAAPASLPEPRQFSPGNNDYVPGESVTGYPRGVNPLRMHTSISDFATAPADVELPNPQISNKFVSPAIPADADEDDHDIEDAPIYSPSSGNLSQYSRQQPSSTTALPDLNEHETPTHVPFSATQRLKNHIVVRKSGSAGSIWSKARRKLGGSDHHGGHQSAQSDALASLEGRSPLAAAPSQPGVPSGAQMRRGNLTPSNEAKRRGWVGSPDRDYTQGPDDSHR